MSAVDPLIRMDLGLVVPPEATLDQALALALEVLVDAQLSHAIAWPARDRSGQLVAPPADHVLDYLAREYYLADEEVLEEDESLGWPGANTVEVLPVLPPCDLCQKAVARYDAHVSDDTGNHGGAFLCGHCYLQHGSGTLGSTGDRYLLLATEVDPATRATCNQLLANQDRPALFAMDGSFIEA